MLSVSPVRSSLEEMLDSLRQREEGENPKELPPALPARPTSKARRPKRPVPAIFVAGDVASPEPDIGSNQAVQGVGGGGFGRKKVKETAAGGESPYTTLAAVHQHRLAENGGANLATPPSPSGEVEWDDSIDYFFKKKLRVWCRLPDGQWELGKIQSTEGETVSVMLLQGTQAVTVSRGELLPANAEILDGVNDLVELGYLNDPSVVHNLQYRYTRDVIYTMVGPILLAINPFKKVDIFGSDFIEAYKAKILDNPHVYATVHTAYDDMMRDNANQSIIISGENGSGKTETAKLAMEYLVGVGGETSEMGCKLLKAGCILEALGNAKTSRNNNSSRFGKLIDIHYSTEGIICGAYIQTLLLEKVRASQLCRGERSYHVFYQLCAGAPSDLKERLNLKMASEYKFLNQSGCLKISGVDDAENFGKLTEALDTLQVPCEDQERVFEVLAAILWLGNISFEVVDDENHVMIVTDEATRTADRLTGCKVADLMQALSTDRKRSEEDNTAQTLTLENAIDTRDTLARFLYASLFGWLIEEINKSLEAGPQHTTISVLDPCGFELFQKNSFEQLLINYADERLQQHFIRHMFKLEQEEYESEGIDWKRVEFEDNQECLDLFEKKPTGLLYSLDEASNASESTDSTFVSTLTQHVSSSLFLNDKRGAFRVHHSAGEVRYEANGFLEKNRDTLQSAAAALSPCCKQLPCFFATRMLNRFETSAEEQSVAATFKARLFELIRKLENSKPHFVRCVRPNSKQLSGTYEKGVVGEQLRCGGVVEIARISRSRYPTRLTHHEFASRFGCLLSENIICLDPLSTSLAILQQYRVLPETYRVGYTKLFFRAEQFGALENLRREVLEGSREAENGFLGGRVLLEFRELKSGVVALQSFVRGENARSRYDILKDSSPRCVQRSLDEELTAAVVVQSVVRGWLARRYFSHLRGWKKSVLDSSRGRRKSLNETSEPKGISEENLAISASNVEELQRRVLEAETALRERELENAALREQLRKTSRAEPNGETRPAKLEPNGGLDHLAKELDQSRRGFDEAVVEVRSNPMADYRKLKQRFETWKREYKHRLCEAKGRISSAADGDKRGRHWWERLGKRC